MTTTRMSENDCLLPPQSSHQPSHQPSSSSSSTTATTSATKAVTTTTTKSTTKATTTQTTHTVPNVVGVQGVHLKRYEQVVAKLLPHVEPYYVKLPTSTTLNALLRLLNSSSSSSSSNVVDGDNNDDNTASNNNTNTNSPSIFSQLPSSCRVYGSNGLGQLSNKQRATKKEQQVQCIIQCIFKLLDMIILKTKTTTTVQQGSRKSKNYSRSYDATTEVSSESASSSSPPPPLPLPRAEKLVTIIDFGGGTGHVAIPLAILLQKLQQQPEQDQQCYTNTYYKYRVIVVDLKRSSLELLHRKAAKCGEEESSYSSSFSDSSQPPPRPASSAAAATSSSSTNKNNNTEILPRTLQVCHGIPNLYTYHGPIESYTNEAVDVDADTTTTRTNNNNNDEEIIIGIALHVCGEATDITIKHCCNTLHAFGIVVAPCCVGKLNTNVFNPYIFHATQQNIPTIQYPQSNIIRNILLLSSSSSSNSTSNSGNEEGLIQQRQRQQEISLVEDWNSLAKAADYNSCNIAECTTPRNACRRMSKSLLEVDRQLYLQEQIQIQEEEDDEDSFGYESILTRMVPWEASPKNDIIMAWKTSQQKKKKKIEKLEEGNDYNHHHHGNNNKIRKPISLQPNSTNESFQWEPCDACNADLNWVKQHLFQPQTLQKTTSQQDCSRNGDDKPQTGTSLSEAEVAETVEAVGATTAQRQHDRVDWTVEEEEEIVQKLRSIFPDLTDTAATSTFSCNYVFPPEEMNKRKRKLVHYVAARLNLKSWGQGKKHSEKTVVVSKKKM